MESTQRIDKYLWLVRIFKTRSLATLACNGGKVKLNGSNTKPSKDLKPGDKIEFKRSVVQHTIEVVAFPKSRISAKDILLYYTDLTPPTELIKLQDMKFSRVEKRDQGAGRPTKKQRRDIDKLKGGN
jgi:ribosome-associated heat shock protein Hsp15